MKTPDVSRRGFFAALVGKGAPPPRPKPLPGLVPAGEVFSLEAFYAARAAEQEKK